MHISLVILLIATCTFAIVDAKCAKRGIAYTFPNNADLKAVSNGISWWYNWGLAPTAAEQSHAGVEFVPMVWGQRFLTPAPHTPAGTKYLLGFNEPNFFAQSNLPASTAASLWPKVKAAAAGVKIVSPAVNFCGGGCTDTDPEVYLDKFFAACKGCEVDYIAIHWYGCTTDSLKWYLNKFRKYNKKVWVTEFSCAKWDGSYNPSPAFHIAYMKAALQILENDPMIFRYAWFTGRTSDNPVVNIFGGNGQLTDLGKQYIAQPCGAPVSAIAGSEGTFSSASTEPAGLQNALIACVVVLSVVLVVLTIGIIIVARKFNQVSYQ